MNSNEAALNSSGNETNWDLDAAQCAVFTMNENSTIMNPTNMNAGGTYVLRVVQAAGLYGLSWDTAYQWGIKNVPVAPAANGDVVVLTFYTDGTLMYGGEFVREEA